MITFQTRAKFALMLCLLLFTIVACQRTVQPQVDKQTTSNLGNTLETTSTEAREAWLPALISEYLQDEGLPSITVGLASTTVIEGGSSVSGFVSHDGTSSATITLTSSDATQLTILPTTITLAAGVTVPFTVTALDDSFIEDSINITVTGSVSGFTSDSVVITVLDNDADCSKLQASLSGGHLSIVDSCASFINESLTIFDVGGVLVIQDNSGNPFEIVAGAPALFVNSVNPNIIGVTAGTAITQLTVDTKPTATTTDVFTTQMDLILPGGLDVSAHTIQLPVQVFDTQGAPMRLDGFKTVATSAAGTMLTSTSGSISVSGNYDGTACRGVAGNFMGINISGINISSASGVVSLRGCGGNSGAANNGVALGTGTRVKSTAGSVTISGQGGNAATSGNTGVYINTAIVESDGTAPITITGAAGTGGTTNNTGVVVFNAATGTSYGTSGIYSKDGHILVTGQGGVNTTDKSNIGVRVQGMAEIKSTGAATINVKGNGGSGDCPATNPNPIFNECSHNGIDVLINAQIVAAGTGTVSLEGYGGSGNGREHHGITISIASSVFGGATAKVMSSGPDIMLTGVGGIDTSTSKVSGSGIYLIHGGSIEATNSANIIMNGTAGKGLNEGNGIWLEGDFKNGNGGLASFITAQNGSITMTGQGNTTAGSQNSGITLLNGNILTTGTGNITITGTGGAGTQEARGVMLTTISKVSTFDGNIEVTGTGGTGSGPASSGVAVLNEGEIVSNSGIVNIVGIGDTGSSDNQGVVVGNTIPSFVSANGVTVPLGPSKVQTTSGAINVTGIGGNGTEAGNIGVQVGTGVGVGSITSTSGTLTINGTGGVGTQTSIGVFVLDTTGSGSTISSSSVVVTGTSGRVSGTFNPAVYLNGGTIIQNGVPANMPGNYLPLGPVTVPVGTTATVTF